MLHENVLLSFIFILLTAAFIILVLYGDFKGSVGNIKKGVSKGTGFLDTFMNSFSYLDSLKEYTEYLITRTGIPFYNVWLHFVVCVVSGILAFRLTIPQIGFLLAFVFSILLIASPYAVLKLLGDIMAERERRYSIDFLTILHNFIKSGAKHDIFEAFTNVIPYVVQPLKRYLEDMIFDYDHKTNPVTCLERFKSNVSTPELRLYIDNVSICYVQGGDIEGLTEAYIKEISTLEDDSDKEDAEDRILNYGLYILLFMNFAVVSWTLKGPYKTDILGNTAGQIIFMLDMVISMYIMYMTLKRT